MLGRKRKETPEPMPPWIKWGALAFIVIAVLMNAAGFRPTEPVMTGPAGSTGPAVEKPDWNRFSLSRYKSMLHPEAGKLHILADEPGSGSEAFCGQTVTVQMSTEKLLPNANAPTPGFQRPELSEKEKANKPVVTKKKLTLGEKDLSPFVSESVHGMRVGGKRTIHIPLERLEGKSRFPEKVTFEVVELHTKAPDVVKSNLPLHRFEQQTGIPPFMVCGSTVKAQLHGWDTSGNELFRTTQGRAIPLTLGITPVMQGLTEGIIGMGSGGTRTLIIPPSLQKAYFSAPASKKDTEKADAGEVPEVLRNFKPLDQAIIVDITLVP